MYILAFVRNGKITYDTSVVGDYGFVKRIADQKAPGLMAQAISYAYYLGTINAEVFPPFTQGSIEECHFHMGSRSSSKGNHAYIP